MNKLLKASVSIILAAVLICASVVFCFATAYTTLDGYTFSLINTGEIALYGYDRSSTTLTVPERIGNNYFVSIDNLAFCEDDFVEEIDLSQATRLTTIGDSAFLRSTALKRISIPETVTNIMPYAFGECSALETAEINANITVLNKYTFSKCPILQSVTLPDSLTSIEKYAMANCPLLTDVVIGKNVTSIASSAFKNSPNVTISCFPDTYAYQYAVDHNIPVKLLHEVKLGDADSNGVVNINDVTAIQGHKAEMFVLDELQLLAADINYDGKVDIEDATILQSYLAEYAVDYPVDSIVAR